MTEKLPFTELRDRWSELWGIKPHKGIGRAMMECSIEFKLREKSGSGFTPVQHARLVQLIKQYKRNSRCFDEECAALKPGTRLIRNWKGKRYTVLVKSQGFDYGGAHFSSLSQIANDITGSRWNGRAFFGLKKKGVI